MTEKIRVVELFAGVGGFRLGLEGYEGRSASSGYSDTFHSNFEVIWSNQWEPNASVQHASNVYRYRWPGANHTNRNIFEIAEEIELSIPDHELLVGGFPCQDYSVANTLKRSGGIEGKKGVLWWAIHEILRKQRENGHPTKYLLLENVDRLLKSPRGQRGRDFAIMLASLHRLGYAVEWRIVNAADYGMPQRRRRIFLLAYHESTGIYEQIERSGPDLWLERFSVMRGSFPVEKTPDRRGEISLARPVQYISANFNKSAGDRSSPFLNSGLMIDGIGYTSQVVAPELTETQRNSAALRNYLDKDVPQEFWVPDEAVNNAVSGWLFHKSAKARLRIDKETGHEYQWSEGGMSLYDDLSKPARTIITSEGGSSPSRSKHLISINGLSRRLTPRELDRVSMFPDDHTRFGLNENGDTYELSSTRRAFLIGNALVAGVVQQLGLGLLRAIELANVAALDQAKNRNIPYEVYINDLGA